MRDGRYDSAFVGAHGRHEQHEWRLLTVHLEKLIGPLAQHGRGERAEEFPELDLAVDDLLHLRVHRVGENAPATERARTELHPALEPADHFVVAQDSGGALEQLGARQFFPAHLRAGCAQRRFHLRFVECRAQIDIAQRELARVAQHGVVNVECRADGATGVTGGRLDEQTLERRLLHDFPIRDSVERATAGQTEIVARLQLVGGAREVDGDFLEYVLSRPGDVLVKFANLRLRHTLRLSEELFEAAVEHALGAVMMREVAHVQREAAVGLGADELPAWLDVCWLAVGREAHDFPLGIVHFEAQVGGDRAVKQTERMWKADLARELDFRAATPAHRGRRPFADAVERQDGGFLEGRDQKRARGM